MRIEIDQLKSENTRLHQFLQQNQQQSHQANSSVSSPSPASSVSSAASANHHHSKINLSLSIHNVDHILTAANLSSASSCSSTSCSLLKSPNKPSTPISQTNNNTFTAEFIGNSNNSQKNEGKKVPITVYIGECDNPLTDVNSREYQIHIGYLNVGTRTKWDLLDANIRRQVKEYINRLDEVTVESGGLGLNLDSIEFYYVGEMLRSCSANESQPDLLPYGYLVGENTSVVIKLKDACQNCLDTLCYDTLVPKSVLQRYISLISEHKNLLFCGPNGTNKSYVARKIAEYLLRRQQQQRSPAKSQHLEIVYFNVDNKTSKDLKQFLNTIIAESSNDEAPSMILILDNLHSITNISDAFSEYFSARNAAKKCSYVIGTVNQSNVTALNLHHQFKWVLCVNHTEPVKNYLSRYLERRLIDYESKMSMNKQQSSTQPIHLEQNLRELKSLYEWIPKLWQHVNKYIEAYNSIDLTIGPKLLITCPLDFKQAQSWFVDMWNNTLVPTMIDIIKEGIQVYDTKIGGWEDPKIWLHSTLPWLNGNGNKQILYSLSSIGPRDVGYGIELENNELQRINENHNENSGNNNGIEMVKRRMDDDDFLIIHSSQAVVAEAVATQQNRSAQFFSCQNTPAKSNGSMCRNSNDSDKLLNMLLKLQEATMRSSMSISEEQQQQLADKDILGLSALSNQKEFESIL